MLEKITSGRQLQLSAIRKTVSPDKMGEKPYLSLTNTTPPIESNIMLKLSSISNIINNASGKFLQLTNASRLAEVSLLQNSCGGPRNLNLALTETHLIYIWCDLQLEYLHSFILFIYLFQYPPLVKSSWGQTRLHSFGWSCKVVYQFLISTSSFCPLSQNKCLRKFADSK